MPARIVRPVDDSDTVTPGKWAHTDRPVRTAAGVSTEVDEEGKTRDARVEK